MEGGRKDGKGEEWEGRGGEEEGYGRGKRVGKGEGELDLDICSGAPESLVTPLRLARTQRTVHWMEVQVPNETSADSLLAEMYTDVRCGMRTKVAPLQRSICGGGDAICRYHYCGNLFPT